MTAVLLLSACGASDNIPSGTEGETFSEQIPAMASSPVDVQTAFIAPQALQPQAITVAQGNLFDNGGFESGLAGWTACDAGSIATSSDALEGTGALQVNPGNCFYRSASVSVGQKIALSCNVKIQNGTDWTGMGFNFADGNFATLSSAPTAVATSNSYTRLDTVATAPENTQYVSMWLYSDNLAVVDNCSLLLETDPPPPPPPSGNNFLENGVFNGVNGSQPAGWAVGCANSASLLNNELSVSGGTCVDQALDAGEVNALRGNSYTLQCFGTNASGYAALSIFFDGAPVSKVIPVGDFVAIELAAIAPATFSTASVSVYAEGALVIDNCSFTVDGSEPPAPPSPPAPSGDNFLENGEFNGTNGSQPASWSVGCGNSASLLNNELSVSEGTCVDQALDTAEVSVLRGNSYSLECFGTNASGYAALSILFDGAPVSKVIPVGAFGAIELSATAPANFSNATVSIYADGALTVDDCSLVFGAEEPSTPTSENILENGDFENFDSNNQPIDWTVGCGGSIIPTDNSVSGKAIETIGNSTCIEQSFSPEKLQEMSGKAFIFECKLQNARSYGVISYSFDGIRKDRGARASDVFNTVLITGVIPENPTQGFVSLYTESSGTQLDDCSFTLSSADIIDFTDDVLEVEIRQRLGIVENVPVYEVNMLELRDITLFRRPSDLNGLQFAKNLERLELFNDSDITNVNNLVGLEKLVSLDINGNAVSDLSDISQLTSLTTLEIGNNNISDISGLANLTNLKTLVISGNNISNIDALTNLVNLELLSIDGNNLSNLSNMGNLNNLRILTLSNNNLTSLAGLELNTGLKTLLATNNQITDFSAISNLQGLESLFLSNNQITDVDSLSNLNSIKTILLDNNQIRAIPDLSNLNDIRIVNMKRNLIDDISNFNTLPQGNKLRSINLSVNKISNIDSLSALFELSDLDLRNNLIADISALSNLPKLGSLYLQSNNISDISPLVDNLDFGGPSRGASDWVRLSDNLLDLRPGSDDVQNIQILRDRDAVVVASSSRFQP